MTSFHQKHRELLLQLGSPEVLGEIMNRTGSSTRWWTAERVWHRDWAKVIDPDVSWIQVAMSSPATQYDPAETCVLDFRADGRIDHRQITPSAISRFPDDQALPTLKAVMERYPNAEVVRYRPGKRCTLRTADGTYLKVFGDGRGEAFQQEALQLWAASQRGALGFSVARPMGFDPDTNTFAQAMVTGEPIHSRLFSDTGEALAAALGAAAATLPTADLAPANVLDGHAELARLRKRVAELDHYVPNLSPRIRSFEAALTRLHGKFQARDLVPIHGSPHPSQWLIDGSRLGLVDFDRLSLGDPEVDIATFGGEVDFERKANVRAIGAAFQHGYEEAFGPLDPARLTAYRAHKRFAKVYRTARSIRPDADARTSAHLETAMSTVESGGLPS